MNDERYGKIEAVELVGKSQQIKEAFIHAFVSRYHFEPVMTEQDDLTFKWAYKVLGFQNAVDAVSQYLRMDSEWFIKNAHSLKVFQTNINQIMASVKGKRPMPSRRLRITTVVKCDYCPVNPDAPTSEERWGKYIALSCYPEELEAAKRQCDSCKALGRETPYQPSPEEREAIFAKLGMNTDFILRSLKKS